MYENQTFEVILARMLARVPDTMDKREGSIIYDALAPAAAELAQAYIEFDLMYKETFGDTSDGEYLTRRAAERGVNRLPASKAIRLGMFTGNSGAAFNPPIDSRFSGDELNYTVIEKINDGQFKIECETAGKIGNEYIGVLLPIGYIPGLAVATLADILVPGEDEETDDSLRQRYFDSLNSQAYGGNTDDYKQKVNELPGVGGVKVYPVWNGGGTVKLVIIDSDYNTPSFALIDDVQTAVDPESNQGEGLGLAPIGHVVTVVGVEEAEANIETNLTFQEGYTWPDVKPGIENVINEYFAEMRRTWADAITLIIRISQIETRALNVTGILDIQNTKINGVQQNLVLDADQIPVLGEVMAI